MRYPQRTLLASMALVLFSGCVQSQAPIVDASRGQRNAAPAPAAAAPSAGIELLLSRIQTLEAEIMQLRGFVEEQGYQLETLKQQSLERYIELDKRVGAAAVAPLASDGVLPSNSAGPVQGGAPAQPQTGMPIDASSVPQQPAAIQAPESAAAPAAAPEGEPVAAATAGNQSDMDAYRDAYAQVKAQDFVGAVRSFQAFLTAYPSSNLVPNAHYWLGELYLQSPQNLPAAEQAFNHVLTQFANHDKAPDALYKLGRIAHMKGDNARAQELLQQVIDEYGASGSAAPQLAKQFLDQNFR